MRYLITIILISFNLSACAMGKTIRQTPERKMQDKLFRSCKGLLPNYLGKFCNRRCSEIKKGSCKKWDLKIIDTNKDEDYNFIDASSFILIDEDQVL